MACENCARLLTEANEMREELLKAEALADQWRRKAIKAENDLDDALRPELRSHRGF